MTYKPGDLVVPADLPRRVLCRILETSTDVCGGTEQILKLEPLEGQRWHPAMSLVRRSNTVLPVRIGDLWRAAMPLRLLTEHRMSGQARRSLLRHRDRPGSALAFRR